jgi:hypothetical protein
MPLRDHFRPPISKRSSWEGFHGGWPFAICQQLSPMLPDGFVAEPRVHLGSSFEIDVCAFERFADTDDSDGVPTSSGGAPGTATAPWIAPAPALTAEAEFERQYAYEVLVLDTDRGRELVAAVELVSPANKDRPESRQIFVAKCATLLSKGVCVSIVDLVTARGFNLYAELLALKGLVDPAFASDPSPIYAATCRTKVIDRKPRLDMWSHPLVVGRPLPILPLWLSPSRSISLDLEVSYEQVCETLKIR